MIGLLALCETPMGSQHRICFLKILLSLAEDPFGMNLPFSIREVLALRVLLKEKKIEKASLSKDLLVCDMLKAVIVVYLLFGDFLDGWMQ